MKSALVASVLLVSCGGPAAPSPLFTSIPSPPSEPSVDSARVASATPPTPTLDPLPPEIAFPSAHACVLGSPAWRRPSIMLRFSATGTGFARVDGGAVEVHFPIGVHAAAAVTSVTTEALSLRGHVSLPSLYLDAARSFVMNGFVTPTIFTHLRVDEGSSGKLVVGVEPPRDFEIVGAPLSAERPCDDLSLDTASFDPEEAIAHDAKRKPFMLDATHPIDLAIDPGGPAVARLKPPKAGNAVEVFATQGGLSRILWRNDTLLVFGWIATKDLLPLRSGSGFGSGNGRLFDEKRPTSEAVRCATDVALVAESSEAERATIGSIHAGTTIHVLERGHPFSKVEVRSKQIVFTNGLTFEALESVLSRCTLLETKSP